MQARSTHPCRTPRCAPHTPAALPVFAKHAGHVHGHGHTCRLLNLSASVTAALPLHPTAQRLTPSPAPPCAPPHRRSIATHLRAPSPRLQQLQGGDSFLVGSPDERPSSMFRVRSRHCWWQTTADPRVGRAARNMLREDRWHRAQGRGGGGEMIGYRAAAGLPACARLPASASGPAPC